MKTRNVKTLAMALAVGCMTWNCCGADAAETDPPAAKPAEDAAPAAPTADAPDPQPPPMVEVEVPAADPPKAAGDNAPAPVRTTAAPAPGPSRELARPTRSNGGSRNTGKPQNPDQLLLNFRGVPLDMVLNYLSDAAGFIIILDTEVKGKVDVYSNQPLTRDEAVELLNTVLHKNGYAALRNGRTLTIVGADDAKKRDLPVRSGGDPQNIPKSDEMVTQIIPVRYISATPLAKDLQPLLPTQATLTANEGGNALVITDSQVNIRRMAEIVRALDTAIASVSSVRVFSLKNADAKALATVIRDLFQTQDTARGNQQGQNRFFNFMRGGGPGGGGQAVDPTGGRAPTTRVVAVADERSNAVVVNAPEEQMPIIEDLIAKVDANVEDVTELRVFRLKYSDPQETADLLTSLFPDSTGAQNQSGQVQFRGRFGGFPGGPGMQANNSATSPSARVQKQSRVLAVPDLRTSSIVVSAAHDLMEQIGKMVETLDSDPARKQKVFVYSVENGDPQQLQQILQQLFPDQNYGNTGNLGNRRTGTTQAGGQLNNRATTMQNQNNNNTGFGSGNRNTGTRTGQ